MRAVDNLSISVEQGEFLTLLGPSGSGKSTFLNILAGFDRPNAGRLLQSGVDITNQPPERRNFGMVFQGYALFPHLSVVRNIAFPLRVRKVPAEEQRRKVFEVLERVGLSGHADKLPAQLSGGQQQRVALARALVFAPDILLLDEPLSALDKSLRGQLQLELQRIHREFGTTFVFVTHDQSEALALSNRIAIFNHGRLMQIGTSHEVYTRPSSRFVAEFLGQINLFPLTNATSKGGIITGRFGERVLRVPGTEEGEILLGIRPEYMVLSQADSKNTNEILAVVRAVSYQGATVQIAATAGLSENTPPVSLSLPAEYWSVSGKKIGDCLSLSWPSDRGMALPRN